MRILFSIEFTFEHKQYCGIVRMIEHADCTEYHVRVMNARLDKWLYNHHIFMQQPGGALMHPPTTCSARVGSLREAVQASLQARLEKQVMAVSPANRRGHGGRADYYVHRITP